MCCFLYVWTMFYTKLCWQSKCCAVFFCSIFCTTCSWVPDEKCVDLRKILAIMWAVRQLKGVYCPYTCTLCIHTPSYLHVSKGTLQLCCWNTLYWCCAFFVCLSCCQCLWCINILLVCFYSTASFFFKFYLGSLTFSVMYSITLDKVCGLVWFFQ